VPYPQSPNIIINLVDGPEDGGRGQAGRTAPFGLRAEVASSIYEIFVVGDRGKILSAGSNASFRERTRGWCWCGSWWPAPPTRRLARQPLLPLPVWSSRHTNVSVVLPTPKGRPPRSNVPDGTGFVAPLHHLVGVVLLSVLQSGARVRDCLARTYVHIRIRADECLFDRGVSKYHARPLGAH